MYWIHYTAINRLLCLSATPGDSLFLSRLPLVKPGNYYTSFYVYICLTYIHFDLISCTVAFLYSRLAFLQRLTNSPLYVKYSLALNSVSELNIYRYCICTQYDHKQI